MKINLDQAFEKLLEMRIGATVFVTERSINEMDVGSHVHLYRAMEDGDQESAAAALQGSFAAEGRGNR